MQAASNGGGENSNGGGENMMLYRVIVAVSAIVLAAAGNQRMACAEEPAGAAGLTVTIAPYLWLPSIDTTAKVPVPGGGTATTTSTATPWDYLPHLNFGAMLAGEAHYERFSVFTDFMYLNVNGTRNRIKSFDQGATHIPVDGSIGSSVSARIEAAVWTLAGGYTVAEGAWGTVDLLAGFRLLYVSETTNFLLATVVTRPDGTVALGKSGSLPASRDIWNGIGGVRGRVYLADVDWFGGGRIFVPFYIDVGAGGSNVTWQAFSGVGYQNGRFGVSIGYRHLAFNQGSSARVQKLVMGGPILAANFSF
jgi:hypothetical protein